MASNNFKKRYTELKSYWEYVKWLSKRPVKGFILYGFGRSGSTLLTSLLNCHDGIYCDSEIFHENRVGNVLMPKAYLMGNARQKCNGEDIIYGVGLMSYQLISQKYISHKNFISDFVSNGWKILHIRRKEILSICISIIKASIDNTWELKVKNKQSDHSVMIPLDKLEYYLKTVSFCHNEEDKLLKEIDCLKITYEDDLEHGNWQPLMDKVFNYLVVESVHVKSDHVKKSHKTLIEQIENYEEVMSIYEKFEKKIKYTL